MKPWRLTPQAEQSLSEIAEWTVKQFGPRQAAAYRDALIRRIDRLAAGDLPHARPCSVLFRGEPDLREFVELQYYREGSHHLIFRETPEDLVVLDVLHVRMDLERHLSVLANRPDGDRTDHPQDP